MDVKFIVSGIQLEDGVNSAAQNIARAIFRAGGEVCIDPNYLSVIYGGKVGAAYYQIRVSDEPILCSGDEIADALIALQLSRVKGQLPIAATDYLSKIENGGLLIYDSSFVGAVSLPGIRAIPVPAYATLKELFPDEEAKKLHYIRNAMMLGALFEIFGFDDDSAVARKIFEEQFRKKPEVLEKNLQAIEAGRAYIRATFPAAYLDKPLVFSADNRKKNRLLMTGNDAISISAINCGVGLYAGYPITPASPLLEFMDKHLRRFGGVAIQAEDEIAAAMITLGAWYGGALAFTATSGPGFSLMIETIGQSGMTETPIVIVDVQRAGPGTGMPTKTEQSDLMIAIFGHHGDMPKIVLAPGDVKEHFEVMPRAFYLARKYQLPVIILSSLGVAEGYMSVSAFDLSCASRFDLNWFPDKEHGSGVIQKRYGITERGISYQGIPGQRDLVKLGGAEHDEMSGVTTNPETRRQMMDKRLRKLETFLREDFMPPRTFGPDEANVVLVGWGSIKGAMLEAKRRLGILGVRARVVHFTDMWPMSQASVERMMISQTGNIPRVFVVEENATAQFTHLLSLVAPRAVARVPEKRWHSVLQYNGRPIEPCTIVAQVLKETKCD